MLEYTDEFDVACKPIGTPYFARKTCINMQMLYRNLTMYKLLCSEIAYVNVNQSLSSLTSEVRVAVYCVLYILCKGPY